MKVSIQHDLPQDEFAKRFGNLAGASFDDAHAALLRAQGIKPVSVNTTYGAEVQMAPAATPEPSTPVPASEPVDLGPIYSLFIALADQVAEVKSVATEKAIFDPTSILEAISNLADRTAALERRPLVDGGAPVDVQDIKNDLATLTKHMLDQERHLQLIIQGLMGAGEYGRVIDGILQNGVPKDDAAIARLIERVSVLESSLRKAG